ncbi:chaperonin-like RbcX protein 2, chloroplastic [Wolffia australiana]
MAAAAVARDLSLPACLCSAVEAPSLRPGATRLGTSFTGEFTAARRLRCKPRRRSLVVSAELGGQYEESFEDVHQQLITYFTYKAVRTVLHQLYEMNPPKYTWFYNFLTAHKPDDGKRFLRLLGKEKQDLAERVMITRLHLYAKWIKKCDHPKMYDRISAENLELMRERLIDTVIWPSDDINSDSLG